MLGKVRRRQIRNRLGRQSADEEQELRVRDRRQVNLPGFGRGRQVKDEQGQEWVGRHSRNCWRFTKKQDNLAESECVSEAYKGRLINWG